MNKFTEIRLTFHFTSLQIHAVWGIRDGLTRDDFDTTLILGNFKGFMLLKTSKNLILKGCLRKKALR